MKLAFGHLGFSSQEFWAFSLREWQAAFIGYGEKNGSSENRPMNTPEFEQLKKRYPDGRKSD